MSTNTSTSISILSEKIATNRIIQELIAIGDFSDTSIKQIYHKLCKETHPDLTGKDSYDFVHLQREYSEALNYFDILKERFARAKSIRQTMQNSSSKTETNSPRPALFLALHHYTAAGLHSVKIRRRSNLRERNIAILQEVIYQASIYDPSFIPIFIEYNRAYLRTYKSWRSEQQFSKGRKLFLNGLNRFLDYQKMGNQGSARAGADYLQDALLELSQVKSNSYQLAIINFAQWLLKELSLPPVHL